MTHVEAIYRHGTFQPLEPVHFSEEQRVRLSIEPAVVESADSWLKRVRELQSAIVQRIGLLSDSTSGIAADRLR
jgi:predicted DNA-binding antitoxin AbrB/MazE fold protein